LLCLVASKELFSHVMRSCIEEFFYWIYKIKILGGLFMNKVFDQSTDAFDNVVKTPFAFQRVIKETSVGLELIVFPILGL